MTILPFPPLSPPPARWAKRGVWEKLFFLGSIGQIPSLFDSHQGAQIRLGSPGEPHPLFFSGDNTKIPSFQGRLLCPLSFCARWSPAKRLPRRFPLPPTLLGDNFFAPLRKWCPFLFGPKASCQTPLPTPPSSFLPSTAKRHLPSSPQRIKTLSTLARNFPPFFFFSLLVSTLACPRSPFFPLCRRPTKLAFLSEVHLRRYRTFAIPAFLFPLFFLLHRQG